MENREMDTNEMEHGEGPSASVTPNGFEFTIGNGQVTGMQRVVGSHTFDLRLPGNATFGVGAGTVTETVTGAKETEVLQFAQDPSNASLYHLASETETIANPTTTNANGTTSGYSFTISNGTVAGMQRVWGNATNTHTHDLLLSPTASFSVSGGTVTETRVEGNSVETLQFVASGSAGLYAVASETTNFIQAGSATTLLSVEPFDRAKFTVDAGGNVTQVQHVRPDGTVTTVTPNAHTSFSQLSTGDIQETVTNGTRSSYEVYHDGNGDGIYTAIAHGAGTTVDLVGLQAQLSATINAVT